MANFKIDEDPLCKLVPHSGSDRAWVWMAMDYSDGDPVVTKFAIRLSNPEEA